MARNEAIYLLKQIYTGNPNDKVALQMAIEALERKRGEWKPKTPLSKSYRFVCSVCGGTAYYCSGSCASVRNNVKNVCRYNFCPNCGADMRVKGENNDGR